MGREIPNSLGWEPETNEEYTKRLEGIVKSWHKTHTTMTYKLKQHIKKLPHLNPHIREDYPLTTEAIDDWFQELKIIVSTKETGYP